MAPVDRTRKSPRWQWREGPVDPAGEHIALRYGDASRTDYEQWTPVAVVGRPSRRAFPVRWQIVGVTVASEVISEVRRQLDFYLVDKQEPDPWAYAVYHCGTAANVYSRVHWSYLPAGAGGERHSSMVVKLFPEGAARLLDKAQGSDDPDLK